MIMEKLTIEQEELLHRFDELAEKTGSAKQAASLIGISAATISQIKNGQYAAAPDNIFRKIAAYVEVKTIASGTYKEVQYAPTYVSEAACDIMRLCQVKGYFAVICGDAGIGKTKAIEQYAEEHPTNTVAITINECFARSKPLLGLIAEKIGAPREKSADDMWKSVAGKLTDGMLIIIDESQHLSMKTVDMLRSFPDYFKSIHQTVGICLVGNLETGYRFGTKSSALAQVKSRTRYTATFSSSQAQRSDIAKLFPLLKIGVNDPEIDFLLKIARSEQGIRGTVNLFSNAYDNDNVSYAGLVAMAKDMDLQI